MQPSGFTTVTINSAINTLIHPSLSWRTYLAYEISRGFLGSKNHGKYAYALSFSIHFRMRGPSWFLVLGVVLAHLLPQVTCIFRSWWRWNYFFSYCDICHYRLLEFQRGVEVFPTLRPLSPRGPRRPCTARTGAESTSTRRRGSSRGGQLARRSLARW